MSVFDKFRLDGKRALITGGSRGLGRAMAQALAEAGADLVLIGREEANLKSTAQELTALTDKSTVGSKVSDRRVDYLAADMSTPIEAEHTCRNVLSAYAPIDILINNVGGRRINIPTEQMPTEEWLRILDLNLTSAFVCSKLIGSYVVVRVALGSARSAPGLPVIVSRMIRRASPPAAPTAAGPPATMASAARSASSSWASP